MRRNESGQVTAFVVTMMSALLLLAGLVFDGGNMLVAKRRAINEAEAAARAGAQALDTSAYRSSGVVSINPAKAKQAAEAYIAATGAEGTAEVTGSEVRVHLSRVHSMSILGIAGLHQVTVSGDGVANAVRGVEVAE